MKSKILYYFQLLLFVFLATLVIQGCQTSGDDDGEEETLPPDITADAIISDIRSINTGIGMYTSSQLTSNLRKSGLGGALQLTEIPCLTDGTLEISISGLSSITISGNDCTTRIDANGDSNPELLTVNNNSLEVTIGNNTITCPSAPSLTIPNPITYALNGSNSLASDKDSDGILDADYVIEFTDYTSIMTVKDYDFQACEGTGLEYSTYGELELTNNLDSNDSFSKTIPEDDPITLTFTRVTGGTNITISGTFSLTSSCANGSATISTETPIFLPSVTNSENICPTSGVIALTGDPTSTITFTSTGGVQIDEGSDGSVDQEFSDCNEVDACE